MKKNTLAILAAAGILSGCTGLQPAGPEKAALDDAFLAGESSAGPLAIVQGAVITDNDAAFQSKLRLVEEARSSLDLSYYIYSDDQSSSVLSEALIAAARRGVRVRLLADYQTNYQRLDMFTALERRGNTGKGSLEVRLYGRPTRNVVMDAAYMAMGCGPEAVSPARDCSAEKFAAVDQLFADEKLDGVPAATLNASNLNTGASGLLLSGLYGKNGELMALAVQHGQGVDMAAAGGRKPTAEQKEGLKRLGRLYWQSRTGPAFQRLGASLELMAAEQIYADQVLPVRNALFSALPVNRKLSAQEERDWRHFTDFTHHKFLLADAARIQLGGRNVENSYHMHPNPMVEKYVFMDADLVATVARGGGQSLEAAFDQLWDFRPMVARLDEVRAHAPNDMLMNLDAYPEAEKVCADIPQGTMRESCVDGKFKRAAKGLDERVEAASVNMSRNADAYRRGYAATIAPAPALAVDAGARLWYLENLPFDKTLPAGQRVRLYGAASGREGADGKHIMAAWIRGFAAVCAEATPAEPRVVYLHNAYFLPPANLAAALAGMADGGRDCANVTVKVVTNSLATTDLAPVNLVARHVVKAFAEYVERFHASGRSARFEYYEYQPPAGGHNLSLHSKVTLIGDRLVLGSANADVRSFMMDSNNAMLLDSAPSLAAGYRAFLERTLAEPGRVKRLNDYFLATPRDEMIREDLESLRAKLARYHMDRHLNPEQLKETEAKFVRLLNAAYDLTRDSLDGAKGGAARRAAQDRFDELFAPI